MPFNSSFGLQHYSVPIVIDLTAKESGKFTIGGEALHAKTVQTSSGELEFAPNDLLAGLSSVPKYFPLLKNHDRENVDSIVGLVDSFTGVDNGQTIKFSAHVEDKKIQKAIDNGLIRFVSVGLLGESFCSVCNNQLGSSKCGHMIGASYDGIACKAKVKNIKFKELSLVVFPADDDASFEKMAERVVLNLSKSCKDHKLNMVNRDFLEELYELAPARTDAFERCIADVAKQFGGMDNKKAKSRAFAICISSFKKAGKPIFKNSADEEKWFKEHDDYYINIAKSNLKLIDKTLTEELTDNQIALQFKDHPDSDFAYVPDDAKGPDGDKSKRKLPIFDSDHVKNALARFNQTDLPADVKGRVLGKICARARKFGIDSDFCKEKGMAAVDEATIDAIEKDVDCAECYEEKLLTKIMGKMKELFVGKVPVGDTQPQQNLSSPVNAGQITSSSGDTANLNINIQKPQDNNSDSEMTKEIKDLTIDELKDNPLVKKLSEDLSAIQTTVKNFEKLEQERKDKEHKALASKAFEAVKGTKLEKTLEVFVGFSDDKLQTIIEMTEYVKTQPQTEPQGAQGNANIGKDHKQQLEELKKTMGFTDFHRKPEVTWKTTWYGGKYLEAD